MRLNKAKHTLEAGGVILGMPVMEFATTGISRIAQAAHADFLLFDMEHSGFGIDTIRTALAFASGTSVTAFVRVSELRDEYVGQVLDAGAQGVVCPMVETVEDCDRLAAAATYPPGGRRGIAYGIAHDDYAPGDPLEKMSSANEEVLLVAMIETAAGLQNVDAIAAHPAIDVVWVGHYDLAASLGVPGRIADGVMLDAFERVAACAAAYGKVAGRGVGDPEIALASIRQGYRALSFSRDILLLRDNLARGLSAIRAGMPVG